MQTAAGAMLRAVAFLLVISTFTPVLSLRCCHRLLPGDNWNCDSEVPHDWCFSCEGVCRLMNQSMPEGGAFGLGHIEGIQEGCETYSTRLDDSNFDVLTGLWCFCRSNDFCNKRGDDGVSSDQREEESRREEDPLEEGKFGRNGARGTDGRQLWTVVMWSTAAMFLLTFPLLIG